MAGQVRTRNVSAHSDRLCRADNDALRRLPRFIHQPLPPMLKKEVYTIKFQNDSK